MHLNNVDALAEEELALRQKLSTMLEGEVQSMRRILTDFVQRIEREGVSMSDVAWLNAAYGNVLPSRPTPDLFTDYPSRNGVTQITTLVRGLLNVSTNC